MTLELPGREQAQENSGSPGWLDELFDRREHTLGGCVVGVARDLLDRGSTPEFMRNARARSNDEIAHIAADTAAFLPSLRWTAGGAVRAGLLIDPHLGLADNALLFGKNFAEGAALNKVGKLALPGGAFNRAVSARLGQGILAETVTHASVGAGLGTVKAGFHADSWKDASGKFSLSSGLENVATGAGFAGAVNIPAGMLGFRIARAASVSLGAGTISARTAALISGAGSGYAGGLVFGGMEGISSGKSLEETLALMHKGGLVGAVTGSFVHGFESRRAALSLSAAETSHSSAVDQASTAREKLPAGREKGLDGRRSGKDTPAEHWLDEALDIKPKSLNWPDRVALHKRLLRPVAGREALDVARDGARGPFKSYDDFTRRGLREVKVPVRIYEVEGHSAKIVVPEDYAVALDQVRDLRAWANRQPDVHSHGPEYAKRVLEAREQLKKHPLQDRALPEDFIHYLDELPDRSLVRKVVIRDGADPDDVWNSQKYNEDFKAAAHASENGEITFFSPTAHGLLREFVFHEWSHLVKFKYGQESHYFDMAARLEGDGWYARDYAKRNPDENFAVHMGEEMLHWDADRFSMLAEAAPVRTSVMARSLVRVLGDSPPWGRGRYNAQFAERLRYVEREILPKAQDSLVKQSASGNLETRKLAVQMLGVLGGDEHLGMLKQMAIKPGNQELSELALDAALSLARTPKRRFDVLMEVGKRDSAVHEIAVDLVKRMRDYRAPSYWRYLEWAGRPEHLQDLVKLVDTMPDNAGRQMAFDEALRLARHRGNAFVLGELMNKAPNVEAKRAAFGEILNVFKGNPQQRTNVALKALLLHKDLRLQAIEALASSPDTSVAGHLRGYVNDSDQAVAGAARRVVQAIDRNSRFETLTSALANGTIEQKVQAAAKLGALKDLRAVKPLLIAQQNPSEHVSAAARQALENFSPTVIKFETRALAAAKPRA